MIKQVYAKCRYVYLKHLRWKTIQSKIKELVTEQGKSYFYLYPNSKSTRKVKELLNQYSNTHVQVLHSLSDLTISNNEWSEDMSFLISTNGDDMYNQIRSKVYRKVPRSKVEDLFPINPISRIDARAAQTSAFAREVYEMQIEGAVAEAGVYKGDYSKLLNLLFPDRKLYLFDTFEGFSEEMVTVKDDKTEVERYVGKLSDTSEKLVLSKLAFPQNAVIRKGFFPKTAEGIEDKFCFVMLDMDMYEATKAGMDFFWEKVVPGGVIFVHDYYWYEGVHKAVEEFCLKNNIAYYTMTDGNTAALPKPVGR